ncbi:hypothetical protein BDY21DRAFT_373896 [Lineolata rhizophorae]|uniref:PPP4R2-domain-containing protein n=1 Tax=Lineolata rhizophorae TaxID=578093 RepID=A0A6A6NS56_9PEZI|nr:hypothetical protein BDY21DRAFT_373896 [Lineolata rhizophorae]
MTAEAEAEDEDEDEGEDEDERLAAVMLLQAAAADGSADVSQWPRVLDALVGRLDEIVHGEFPRPAVVSSAASPPKPPPTPLSPPSSSVAANASQADDHSASQDSQAAADKENAPPSNASTPSRNRPPVPPFPRSSASPAVQRPASSSPEPSTPNAQGTQQPNPIPAATLELHASIVRSLRASFSSQPPHTLQRLAELILRPHEHYRHLPPFLRAVDRVVAVSSPITIFPLPQAVLPGSGTGHLLNGTTSLALNTSDSVGAGIDSDAAALGGALLTPIPWLRQGEANGVSGSSSSSTSPTSSTGQGGGASGAELRSESTTMVEGPHGAGRIETVSVINGAGRTAGIGGGVAGGPATSRAPSGSGSTLAAPETTTSPPPMDQEEPGDAEMTDEGLDATVRTEPTSAGSPTSAEDHPVESVEAALREQGAVTQGELLRQEQEAGVVPVAVASSSRRMRRSGSPLAATGQTATATSAAGKAPAAATPTEGYASADFEPGQVKEGDKSATDMAANKTDRDEDTAPTADASVEEQHEIPHARGPDEIGLEDTGPQMRREPGSGFDLEAAVGRKKEDGTGNKSGESDESSAPEVEMKDAGEAGGGEDKK